MAKKCCPEAAKNQCKSRVVYLSHIKPINYTTDTWDEQKSHVDEGMNYQPHLVSRYQTSALFLEFLRNALLKQTPSLLSKSFAPVLQLMPSCFLVLRAEFRCFVVQVS